MMLSTGMQREDNDTLIAMETHPDNNYGNVTMNEHVEPQERTVFSDGSTRVDFVLVWEEPLNTEDRIGGNPTHWQWRDEFLNRLEDCGVLQEHKEVLRSKKRICFVLLSAPWSVLCYYAEEISLRVPLEVVNAPIVNWSEQMLSKLSLPNPLSQDVPNPPPDYYTCQFRNNKLERFLGSDDKETFFTTTQRHQVLYEILSRTPYGLVEKGQVGIDRLVSEHVFTAAYPLHEGDFQPPNPPVPPECLSERQILYAYWASWSRWRNYQPLDHIREYFGEKIALYFAWLGFYTAWLLPASLVGTVIFLIGFGLIATDVPTKEVCNNGNSFVMCPICNICTYWNYSSICGTFKAGVLFDNGGTVFFSVFMSLWAVTLLEYWKRTCSALSHRWGCSDFEDIEERPRPEFSAMAPMTVRNPVTGAEEPYFPENQRFNRTVTGCMVLIIMVAVVLIFVIGIITYRSIVTVIIYKSLNISSSATAARIASITASVLNLLVIIVLSRVYIALAGFLTRWEMHRTQTKYEDMFILKVFIFQFVNFYSSPLYIAFFKGRFVGYPGNYNTMFGVRNEDCGAGGCLVDLAQELLVVMVGKQLINNVKEFSVLKLKAWWHKRKLSPRLKQKAKEGEEVHREEQQEEDEEISPWEADYKLLVCEGLFDEYLETVLQFGFITIFVAACPLAPLFALINNWVEIRLDAQKFVAEYRRPVVERAQDIGTWFPILEFITQVAVLSNAFLIAFTSSFVPRLYYRYTRDNTLSGFVNFTLATSPRSYQQQHNISCRYHGFRDEKGEHKPEYFHLLAVRLTFIIIFEHVVFFIGRMIDLIVPDIPEEVEIKMKREHYMAKEALAENQALGKTMIPGDKDVVSSDLRQRVLPPQSDPTQPPPTKPKEIPEETEPPRRF